MADLRGAFLGSGKLSLKDLQNPKGHILLGNCNSLNYQAEAESIEDKDYTTPGGGLDASVQRISALNIAYNARHFTKANIARAVYGESTDVASGTTTAEAHKAFKGALIRLKRPVDATVTVVVKTVGGSPVTYVEGDDYLVSPAGVTIMETGAIADDTDVLIDYGYPKHANIQALVNSGKRYSLLFEGLNEARSGKPVIIEVFKVNHSPASLSVIADQFEGMEFTAKAEKDQTRIGAGLSQYMEILDVD
ncbi:hypothetical protein [Pseudomonas leptonychotis]|uniref:phage tail tube protein n=1 Tax=Pseudomonas leptonychotis TaxID=2448482 RepID=UPI003865E28C